MKINITESQFKAFLKKEGESIDSSNAIHLKFDDIIDSSDEDAMYPHYSGIYIAFLDNFASPKPIYIGKSAGEGGVSSRIKDHIRDDHKKWLKKLEIDEDSKAYISYSTAEYNEDDLELVEAALISANRTCFNSDNYDYYEPTETTDNIICSGYGSLLPVERINTKELLSISQNIKNTK